MHFSWDDIDIVVNPIQRYVDEFTDHVVSVEFHRQRNGADVEIWRNSFEEFYYFMAIDRTSDKPIGVIAVAKDKAVSGNPEDDLFYIGSFFVHVDYRSFGIGKKLFSLAMETSKGANVCLNAATKMTSFYEEKFGFRFYSGVFCTLAKMDTDKIRLQKDNHFDTCVIQDISEDDWEKVAAYDRCISKREREKYLKLWFRAKGARAKVAIDPKTNTAIGFACFRPQTQNRLVVGPFYAENKNIAESLLHKLLDVDNLKSFDQVWLRFPATNEEVLPILESMHEGEFTTMQTYQSHFNKKYVEHEAKRVFSVFEPAISLI